MLNFSIAGCPSGVPTPQVRMHDWGKETPSAAFGEAERTQNNSPPPLISLCVACQPAPVAIAAYCNARRSGAGAGWATIACIVGSQKDRFVRSHVQDLFCHVVARMNRESWILG